MFIFQVPVIDCAIFPACLVCALVSCPLVCSGFLIMWWPELSEDDAVCRERLKHVGQLLQECIPAAKKFEQLVIVMMKYEGDDWEKVAARWEARHASLGPVEPWARPGHAKFIGLPASGDSAAGAASSATRSTSLSGGAPAPVAPPLSAPIAMTQASAASVEAFKQQALADRARAQAQIQQEYERALSQLG